jgi:hypothetical protein|tara:strand:+ start:304 stop:516 length:213 start_codon:yes stop_codon:yes gene_type:complete
MYVSTTITYTKEDDGMDYEATITKAYDEFSTVDYLQHFRKILMIESIGVNGIAVEMLSGEVVWDDPFYNE